MTGQLPVTSQPGESKSSGRSIRPLTSVLRYWKFSFIAAFLVLMVGAPLAWKKGAVKWRAEGALYISPRFLRNLDGDEENQLQSNEQYREFVQQQVRTVTRYDIIQAAIPEYSRQYGLWVKGKESPRHAIDRLRASLQIAPVPDTYQVTVALEADNPQGLGELVNAVMESYVETAHTETLYDSDARVKNLLQEKHDLETTIAHLTEERTKISDQLGTTVFNGSIINSFDRALGASQEALMDARHQRFVAEAAVDGRASKPSPELEATALQNALSDSSLNAFKSSLSQRKAELLVSIQGLSPQHPSRLSAEKEIAAIDRTLGATTAALREQLAENLQTISRAKLEQSASVEQKLVAETKSIREQADEYSRGYQRSLELGEELDRNRKRLDAVEDRISFLQLEGRAPGFVRVFSPAMTPYEPVSGGHKKPLMMVLAAALVFALAVPMAIDFLDPRLRAPGELEVHLGLPLTGWMPISPSPDHGATMRAAISVRRHLEKLRHRAIVVSALHHGSGSTTLCLAVGAALNQLGVRTLVIEANPLTPDPRYISETGNEGLSSALARGAGLPITRQGHIFPDRVPTGPGTVHDLLPVERLLLLLEEEALAWDLILIDAAPLESSLATEELVRIFDAVMLVVDAQKDSKKAVTRCLGKVHHLAPQVFGAVLNKVERQTPDQAFWKKKHDPSLVFTA